MAGTVVADTLQADSTSTLVLKNGVANTPPTIQDSAGTQIGTFCRAWVNFNGTTNVGGFCTIRASFNVTSVADNGTGDYTVNFTTAMPDGNWAAAGIAQLAINSSGRENLFVSLRRENNLSATNARLSVQTSDAAAATDAALVACAFFR